MEDKPHKGIYQGVNISEISNSVKPFVLNEKVRFVFSLLPTLAFGTYYAVFAITHHSFWFGSMALYYKWLVIQKILIVAFAHHITRKYADDMHKYKYAQMKVYIADGAFLIFLEMERTASVIQMISQRNPTEKSVVLVFITAIYTFCRIAMAIVNYIKARKNDDLFIIIIRCNNFNAALVSLLALTSSTITTFGDFNKLHYILISHSVTVSLVCIGVGVWMVARGIKLQKSGLNHQAYH